MSLVATLLNGSVFPGAAKVAGRSNVGLNSRCPTYYRYAARIFKNIPTITILNVGLILPAEPERPDLSVVRVR